MRKKKRKYYEIVEGLLNEKIIFGITSLTVGGAERVLVDLVNRLQDDYEITVFTLYDKGLLQKT